MFQEKLKKKRLKTLNRNVGHNLFNLLPNAAGAVYLKPQYRRRELF